MFSKENFLRQVQVLIIIQGCSPTHDLPASSFCALGQHVHQAQHQNHLNKSTNPEEHTKRHNKLDVIKVEKKTCSTKDTIMKANV